MVTVIFLTICALVPCGLLILKPEQTYSLDWLNSLWQAEYFVQYIRSHAAFPTHYDTIEALGIPFPIIYGYLLYPTLGLIGLAVGASYCIQTFAVFTYLVLTYSTYAAAIKMLQNKSASYFLAIALTFSLYPLTNLYQRSALPEFFSTQYLFISLNLFILLLHNETVQKRCLFGAFLLLSLLLSAGGHPLIFAFGFPLLAIATVFITLHKKREVHIPLKLLAVVFLVFIAVMSPWLFLMLKYKSSFSISNSSASLEYFLGLDSVWGRLLPLPIDYKQIVYKGANGIPDLHSPVTLGLILFPFLYSIKKIKQFSKRWELQILLSLSLFIFLGSTLHQFNHIFKFQFLSIAQFAYRLTTLINFLMFVFCLLVKVEKKSITYPLFVWAILCIALLGTIWKQVQMQNYFKPVQSLSPYLNPEHLPDTFYGRNDYNVTKGIELIAPTHKIIFPITGEQTFFKGLKTQVFATNIYAFPWNRISINNTELNPKLSHYAGYYNFSLDSNEGAILLKTEFKEDPLWYFLYKFSFILLGTTLITLLLISSIYFKSSWFMSILRRPTSTSLNE